MKVLRRLGGLLLMFVCVPWFLLWMVVGIPLFVFGGADGMDFAVWMACWPYDHWVSPLLLS